MKRHARPGRASRLSIPCLIVVALAGCHAATNPPLSAPAAYRAEPRVVPMDGEWTFKTHPPVVPTQAATVSPTPSPTPTTTSWRGVNWGDPATP